jgi:hypothetical protein
LYHKNKNSEESEEVQTDKQQSRLLDQSMHVILPPSIPSAHENSNDKRSSDKVIRTIKTLDTLVSSQTTRKILEELVNKYPPANKKRKIERNDGEVHARDKAKAPSILDNEDAWKGIRPIQAGRYEIFVQAQAVEKETFVYDWLCDHHFTLTVPMAIYVTTKVLLFDVL